MFHYQKVKRLNKINKKGCFYVFKKNDSHSKPTQSPLKAIDKPRLWYPKKPADKIRELQEKKEEL
jgi:hypothetical protein